MTAEQHPANELLIGEQVQHVTCPIKTDNGKIGTGFLYILAEKEGEILPCLVTNKHVIEGASTTSFTVTKQTQDGAPCFGEQIELEIPVNNWRNHSNSEIDLAVTLIGDRLNVFLDYNLSPFLIGIYKDNIAGDAYLNEMDAIEDIIMVRYPTGIFDEFNNLPITRKGITASRIGLPYEGRPEFLIDCACFPGSSGSPIFQFDRGPRQTRDGGWSIEEPRFKFLGILYGGPIFNATGEVIAVPV